MRDEAGEAQGAAAEGSFEERLANLAELEFVEGGNDQRYDFIPKGQVWVDETVDADERPAVALHELTERRLMQRGMGYDEAHAHGFERILLRACDRLRDADKSERETDGRRVPVVTMIGVEHENARQGLVRDGEEKTGGAEAGEQLRALEELKTAGHVGAAPDEFLRALFRRQRFRQHEKAVGRVGEGQRRRRPERRAQVVGAEDAADRRPEREAEAESGAEHAEPGGAPLGRSDVGDVELGDHEASAAVGGASLIAAARTPD